VLSRFQDYQNARAYAAPSFPDICRLIKGTTKHTQWELNAMAKDHTADTSKMKRKVYEKELRKLQVEL
jgi:hypothetical protein